jgi:hypothetical protein
MAAKKQSAAIRPTCDVVEIDGYLVGRTTAKSRIFLIWDAENDAPVAKFGLHKDSINVWTSDFGDVIHAETVGTIANEYYEQRDAKKREAAKQKKSTKKGAPNASIARRKSEAQIEAVM